MHDLREKQRPREPGSEGSILIVTGPPGAGKTTVARILATKRGRAVHLESDRFFHFIVRGFIKPWKPESHAQNTIVMRIVGDVAASYANAGYFTVIDGIVSPRWFFPPLRDSLSGAGLELAYAILRPALPIAVERATNRDSTDLRDPDVIEQLWEAFADLGDLERHVMDNSHESAQRTAVKVDQAMQGGALTV